MDRCKIDPGTHFWYYFLMKTGIWRWKSVIKSVQSVFPVIFHQNRSKIHYCGKSYSKWSFGDPGNETRGSLAQKLSQCFPNSFPTTNIKQTLIIDHDSPVTTAGGCRIMSFVIQVGEIFENFRISHVKIKKNARSQTNIPPLRTASRKLERPVTVH